MRCAISTPTACSPMSSSPVQHTLWIRNARKSWQFGAMYNLITLFPRPMSNQSMTYRSILSATNFLKYYSTISILSQSKNLILQHGKSLQRKLTMESARSRSASSANILIQAIKFSAYTQGAKPEITWINAKEIQNGELPVESLKEYQGLIVPGGFGETGIEGKIAAIKFARENKIPYFGLCYGMQLMTVEYARHVVGLKDANTTEINPDTPHPVIAILPEQIEKLKNKDYGGSMRLGAYPCILEKGTLAYEAYLSSEAKAVEDGTNSISERHRHRYEVNPEYIKQLEDAGLVFSGRSPDGVLMEIAELPRNVHPFMLGTQFHPELRARPLAPHPLFDAFIKAALEHQR